MHPRIPLAFLAARAHCWLMVNLLSTRTPRSLSAELLYSRSTPSLYWCMGLFLPMCRTLQIKDLARFQWLGLKECFMRSGLPSFTYVCMCMGACSPLNRHVVCFQNKRCLLTSLSLLYQKMKGTFLLCLSEVLRDTFGYCHIRIKIHM